MPKALRRRVRTELRRRALDIAAALERANVPRDADTAASLIALGIELAEDLHHSPDDLIRLCKAIVRAEAPAAVSPEADTWGT